MSARHRARRRALDVLFAADMRQTDPLLVLAEAQQLRTDEGGSAMNPYAAELVEGVVQHRERIDEILSTYSLGWQLDRMPGVDRAALRIATYEVLWGGVPEGVALDEAVELVGELSTDESPSFVNGLLGRIVDMRATIDVD
ncbi:MAG: transcription antitermination factor NusB [Candidatus Nanopelagicales bacterium]